MKFINANTGVFVDDNQVDLHHGLWLGFEPADRWESFRLAQPGDHLQVVHGTRCIAYPTAVELTGQHAIIDDSIRDMSIGLVALPGAAAVTKVWQALGPHIG